MLDEDILEQRAKDIFIIIIMIEDFELCLILYIGLMEYMKEVIEKERGRSEFEWFKYLRMTLGEDIHGFAAVSHHILSADRRFKAM